MKKRTASLPSLVSARWTSSTTSKYSAGWSKMGWLVRQAPRKLPSSSNSILCSALQGNSTHTGPRHLTHTPTHGSDFSPRFFRFPKGEQTDRQVKHLLFTPQHLEITIPKAKSDQMREGHILYLKRLNSAYCPVLTTEILSLQQAI